MDPVASAISTALINSTIGNIVAKITSMIEENSKLRKELKEDLQDIKYEMDMINIAIKKHAESEELRGWIHEVQELAFDIEDKIDEFARKVICSPKASRLEQKIHKVKTMGTRTEFANQIQSLRKRAKNAYERKTRYLGSNAPSAPEHNWSPSSSNPYIPEAELVGIAEPKQELLRLLEQDSALKQLKVISILGCRGIGKTTLANVVFRSIDLKSRAHASVEASECKNARDLVADLLHKLRGGEKDTTSSPAQLGENLSNYLQAKHKYLIFIDDLQIEVWEAIRFSFPISTHGRIIVTTSSQSIAADWISNGGYVYRMQPLSKLHSKELLLKEIFGSSVEFSPDFEGLERILKKCNGMPLALVNIAQLLKKSELRTGNYCRKLCRNLGSYLHNEGVLSRMKKVLIYSYDNLPGHDIRTCLLSVSIFPEDHQIKRKRLIRRWLAEGLVAKDATRSQEDVASDYFEKLIDRSLILPIHTSNNAAVKTCQVHGVVLDFIAHKSVSENFITFIHNNEPIPNIEPNSVRRLSLHNTTEMGALDNIDLSRIRSITIFGHVGCCINFEKCKLLRVLDLEKCTELKESDIQNICKLMQLKYLSLRGTNVNKIPRDVSNLQHLETLDIRETDVHKLPIEVLKLPQLAHLFGKFRLPCQLKKVKEGHKLQTFFSQNSKLQTLGGFIIDDNRGFQQIILHLRKLRKVKVWSEDIPSTGAVDLLISSLQTRVFGNNALQSLSIDFGCSSIDFLDTIRTPCILTSLNGKLTKLPDFITSLQDLELQLSSTALSADCLLALQSLGGLLYLKLVGDGPEFANFNFSIENNGFPNLKRLCIQATKLPKLIIGEGAMKQLASLQLLCEDISGFPLDYISHMKGLKEITLATAVSLDMKKVWEKAAKQHKNRPEIIS